MFDGNKMASSFLEHEKIGVENGTSHAAGDLPSSQSKQSVIDVGKLDGLDNTLLAAGDGNLNPRDKTNPSSSNDFIASEIAASPKEIVTSPDLNTSGKRKRDESPDSYSIVMAEDVEGNEMDSSFLEDENIGVENGASHVAVDSSVDDLLSSGQSKLSAVDVGKLDVLDNKLLAAGDGNLNSLDKTNPSSSNDFIVNEIATSPKEIVTSPNLNTSGKRKRDESPDSYSILMAEDVEESIASGLESDVEDNASDTDSKPAPPAPKTAVSVDSSIDKNLPDTVTLLTTNNGGKVYLVGTAHFSMESQEDVAKIIRAVQPHIVLVELCKARVNILQLDEKTILEEAKNINFEKIHSTIKQNGLFHGLMYILLLSMSAHLTKQLGMAPGGEFRRAFAEAKKVPHCLVHLGDRPIHITLQRALASLSWWQTARLTWHLLMSKEPISKEEVERCKRRDLLEEMLAEMTGEFPALSTVFVNERDIYLTHSLQLAALPIASGTVLESSRVVGVVGIGHVPGIVQHWEKVSSEDIPPIMRIPPPSLSSKVIRFGMKASVIGLVLWGCSRFLPLPRSLPTISDLKNSIQSRFQ